MFKSNTLFLIIIFLFINLSGKTISLEMGNIIVGPLVDMTVLDSNYYILDKKYRRIHVFDNKKHLFSFTQAGQGPGDIESPVAISNDGNNIYCMEKWRGKISVFSKKGEFLKTFKLQESSQKILYLLGDLKIFDGKIYIILNRGKEFIRIYDMAGKLLKIISKKKENLTKSSHLYELYMDKTGNMAYVFSRFTGKVLKISLLSSRIIEEFKGKFPKIESVINPIIESEKNGKVTPGNISVTEIEAFFPLSMHKDKLTIISRVQEKKGDGYPAFQFEQGKKPEKYYYKPKMKNDPGYIKIFAEKTFLIDREGNIYIRR